MWWCVDVFSVGVCRGVDEILLMVLRHHGGLPPSSPKYLPNKVRKARRRARKKLRKEQREREKQEREGK